MDHVVRAGAVARLDPDPSEELAVWRSDVEAGRIDDPQETRTRLAAYERGDQTIVRLELFVELERASRLVRLDGQHVNGVWFEAGAAEANLEHAREMIASHLGDLVQELTRAHGVEVAYEDLADAAILVEVDPDLEQRSRAT